MNNFLAIFAVCVLILETSLAELNSGLHHELGSGNGKSVESRTMSEWNWNMHEKIPKISPWQLLVLNDVIVEITLSKCPDLNKTVGHSLKTYIQDQVSKAPHQTSIDVNFFPLYTDLADCLHILASNKNPKSLTTTDDADSDMDVDSAIVEVESAIGIIESKRNEIQIAEADAQNITTVGIESESTQSKFQNFLKSTWNVVWRVARSTLELFMNLISKSKRNSNEKVISAENEFSDLIRTMTLLVRQTCPFSESMISQQVLLSSQVGNQIIDWILKDKEGIVTAAEYFFKNSTILEQIKDCHLKGARIDYFL